MDIRYEKMTENNIDEVTELRIAQLLEEGQVPYEIVKVTCDLRHALKDFYGRNLAEGKFVSWLAFDGDKIVATSGMSFAEKPPYFSCTSGKLGLLNSMYTLKEYRRMGIAKNLLSKVIDEARAYGCGTVHVTASDMGVLLYKNFGFVGNKNFMMYNL